MESKDIIVAVAKTIADLERAVFFHETELKVACSERDKLQHDYDELLTQYKRLYKEVYPND